MKFMIRFKSSLVPVVPYDKEADKAKLGIENWLANPRVKEDFVIVGTRDCVSIWEGESVEQLHFDIMSCPSHRMGEWEVSAILDCRRPGDWASRMQASEVLGNSMNATPALASVGVSSNTCKLGL